MTDANSRPQFEGEALLRALLLESARVKRAAAESPSHLAALSAIACAFADTIEGGGKVLLCGNGGSAADAQHVATEFVVRLSARRERRALAAIALTTDTSLLTACANDYDFEQIFARQVEALGRPGDVLVGISTSGNSGNVIAAFAAAKACGMRTALFTGGDGGKLLPLSDLAFVSPSNVTGHIQETHLAAYHAVCELMEVILFDGSSEA